MERLLPPSSTDPPGIHLAHFTHAYDANCDIVHLRHVCLKCSWSGPGCSWYTQAGLSGVLQNRLVSWELSTPEKPT